MTDSIAVDEDIRTAATLPAEVYTSADHFQRQMARIFARTWHFTPVLLGTGPADTWVRYLPGPKHVAAYTLLEEGLHVPLLFTRDHNDRLHALSNACTHRGHLLVEGARSKSKVVCPYHGARFALDGTFEGMAEMDRPCPNLPEVGCGALGLFVFASVNPAMPLEAVLAPVRARVGFLPLESFRFHSLGPIVEGALDPVQHNHWLLTVDNYLDGRHIPFIHPELHQALNPVGYRYELFEYCNLQVGLARDGVPAFDLPRDHPDYGQRVAAYYFWLFPGTMLNFYPWGLSINLVEPLAPNRTRTTFAYYVWEEGAREHGAGAGLDLVEQQDRLAMSRTQQGLRSPLFASGPFSPAFDRAVHHGHRLVARFMGEGSGTHHSAT